MKLLPNDIMRARPFAAFLDDMSQLGMELVEHGGGRYAVIAARSNPRWWLLPLDSRKGAAAGLEMLQPVTRAAKVAKIVARALAHFGPLYFLGRGHLRLSGMPDLAGAFYGRAVHIAAFSGTDGPHRKTTLQIMNASGVILGYVKMSRTPYLRSCIRNEAKMLIHLSKLNLASADVPRVKAIRDDDKMTLLITDSLKSSSHAAPLRPTAEHLRFLDELRAKTERQGAGGTLDAIERDIMEFLSVGGAEWAGRIASVAAALRPVQAEIPVCLAHGDFTPWNTFLQDGRLYVFDWEYSNMTWPVGFDLAHFILATIPPDQQPHSLPDLLNRISHEHYGGNKTAAWSALLLSLSCHAVFYLGRLAEADSPLSDWIEGAARAAMIDCLLAQRDTLT